MAGQLSMIMNVKVVGEGEQTIVLSHGYGGSQYDWHKVLPYLESQGYQVVLFDWNLHSISDENQLHQFSSFTAFADDLISLMEQMQLRPSVFIGHSMAGMFGCIAYTKRPHLFTQLILIGASPRYINSEDYEGGFVTRDIETMLSNMNLHFQTWTDNFIHHIVGVNDPIAIMEFGKSFKSMNPEVAKSLAKSIFYSDYRDMLDKVEAPCTIIQTTGEFAVPVSVGYYMQSKMKNSKLCSVEMIDIDGHLPQLTASEKLVEIFQRVLLPGLDESVKN